MILMFSHGSSGPQHCLEFRLPWIGHAYREHAGLGPQRFFQLTRGAFCDASKNLESHPHSTSWILMFFFVRKRLEKAEEV